MLLPPSSFEFHDIVCLDLTDWPRYLLWHGWFPALSGCAWGHPWAGEAAAVANNRLETSLCSYVDAHRKPIKEVGLDGVECDLAGPFVWSVGSLLLAGVSGFGVAGASVYAHVSGASWFHGSVGRVHGGFRLSRSFITSLLPSPAPLSTLMILGWYHPKADSFVQCGKSHEEKC